MINTGLDFNSLILLLFLSKQLLLKFRLLNTAILISFIELFFAENTVTSVSDILIIRDDNSTSSGMIFEDAVSAGYNVTAILPELINYEIIESHRLTIVSTGSNPNALINNYMRFLIQRYADEGGKVIIEGGQTGYIALVNPVYPSFQNKVLKINHWTSHDGGNIKIFPAYTGSNLANVPNILSPEIKINFKENTDMDACSNNQYSELFYSTTEYTDKAGIVVYPSVNDPQIINYCFSYAAAEDRSEIKNLLINSIYNLIGSPVSVNQTSSEIPSGYVLEQNYPNPFNSSTVIKFRLPESVSVSINIYDMNGKEINNPLNGFLQPGNYEIKLTYEILSSGVYFYKMQTEEFSAVKSMLLIK